MIRIIACANCFAEFAPARVWQVFCKDDCCEAFHAYLKSIGEMVGK